jgi:hypothetical protein
MSNSGTIRKLTIDGVSYDVPADINITFNRSSFETEGVPTSGRTMFKMTRRVPTMESVVLMTDPAEAEALKNVAEGLADIPISVELADGSTYRTTGKIFYENWETEENRSAVTVIPNKTKDAWTAFLS